MKQITVGIIGGNGGMGRWFADLLQKEGYPVHVWGRKSAMTINKLLEAGYNITHHFEDDSVQAYTIKKLTPVYVVIIKNPAVPKENRRQDEWKE